MRRATQTFPPFLLLLAASLVALPLLAITASAFGGSVHVLSFLAQSVLPRYITTTLVLLLASGAGCLFWGVACAGLLTWYNFRGRNFFCWALALPLAMPAYITGFVYTQLAEHPWLVALSQNSGITINIRSLPALVLLFSFALFPYVFLLVRASLTRQSERMFEAGRVLGFSPVKNFCKLALPVARPAVVAGCTLAMLEVLNDFGTVRLFALQTVSTAIYEVWWLYADAAAAAQLGVITLLFVLALLAAERAARGVRGYAQNPPALQPAVLPRLEGTKATLAFAFCLTPLACGFFIPLGFLVYQAAQERIPLQRLGEYAEAAVNSLTLAGSTALATTLLGFATVLLAPPPKKRGRATRALFSIASAGYALPGSMLAIGALIVAFTLSRIWQQSFLLNSLLLLAAVYMARFLTIALSGAESAAVRITQSITDAAKLMRMNNGAVIRKIHLPLIRGDLLAITLIVFIDGIKELSATFLLRPFDFDTLATQIFELMREEQIRQAAPPALLVTALGTAAILLLANWAQEKSPTTRFFR